MLNIRYLACNISQSQPVFTYNTKVLLILVYVYHSHMGIPPEPVFGQQYVNLDQSAYMEGSRIGDNVTIAFRINTATRIPHDRPVPSKRLKIIAPCSRPEPDDRQCAVGVRGDRLCMWNAQDG